MTVQTTTDDLYKQAKQQIDLYDSALALETHTDIITYALQNLLTDIQNYSGTGKIILSTKTTNSLVVLQQIFAQSSVSDIDISTPTASKVIVPLIALKTGIRALQTTFNNVKKNLGLS